MDDIDFEESGTLLIDGDILVYKPCCVFNDDTDEARENIGNTIKKKVTELCEAANTADYKVYLTTKSNFRNFITDDYKANRADKERPVNLAWAKKFAVHELDAEFKEGLEADDLLAINQTDDTIIWSPDKDLRQVPGKHLDDKTKKVHLVSELGELTKIPNTKPTKYYYSGFKGLMFQALIGDTSDYIIGCGKREEQIYKSGKKKGQKYLKRVGVGPAEAYNILVNAESKEELKRLVLDCYSYIHKDKARKEMEKQVNLLYMVRDFVKDKVRRWTYSDIGSWMDIKTGEVINFANN